MGIFSNLLANTINLDVNLPTTALDKQVLREIDEIIAQGDVEYPVALAVRNEVQSIVQYASDPGLGTFTLTFTMNNGETFTTAGIALDANAATIETAIDTAATGPITGWTNGDITVTGGTLLGAGADVVLTYDGASVAGFNHPQATINGSALFTNEVQSIATHVPTVSGGTFTLTVLLENAETFTTAAIAFAANAATIESAIDTAATGPITGWTNGDISVSGGDLNTAAVVLTFDGTSVLGGNHSLTTIDGALLTGGGSAGVISTTTEGQTGTNLAATPELTTTEGQTNRTGWGALISMGIAVEADVPVQGVAPSAFTSPTTPGSNANYPSQATIRALAEEAAISDDNLATQTEILAAAGLPA